MGYMTFEGYLNYYKNLLEGELETQSSLYDSLQGDAFARRDTRALNALAQIAYDKGWRQTCAILQDTARLIDESFTRRGL